MKTPCTDGVCLVAEARGEHLRCQGACAYTPTPTLPPEQEMPTDDLVSRIQALYEKAESGPWAVDPDDRQGMEWNNHIVSASRPHLTVCFMSHSGTPDNSKCQASAELIVALVNDWPAIKERLERDAKDAVLGRILIRYIDRLTDTTPEDTALKIIKEMSAEIGIALNAARERGKG